MFKNDSDYGWLKYPGKILSSGSFFKAKAKTTDGMTWLAPTIFVSSFNTGTSFFYPVFADIDHIESEQQSKNKDAPNEFGLLKVVPDTYLFPRNKMTLGRFVSGPDMLTFDSGQLQFSMEEGGGHTKIGVRFAGACCEEIEKRIGLFFEAMQICLGAHVDPLCEMRRQGGKFVTSIYSTPRLTSKDNYVSPIPMDNLYDTSKFEFFCRQYIKTFNETNEPFFVFWRAVINSSMTEFFNRALVVGVAIEGVIRSYYNYFCEPFRENKRLQECADKAHNKVRKTAQINRNNNHDSAGIKPKKVLRLLESEGLIEKKLVNSWATLRNKAAHGNSFGGTAKEIQEAFDHYNNCVHLFFLLLLDYIGYDDKVIDYSQHEWPSIMMPQRKMNVSKQDS